MSASIGQKLRQARQARDLSLEKAARDTYIRPQYLQALEAGRLDVLPSEAQARGFLRTYASYLGLDPEPLLRAIRTGEEEILSADGEYSTLPGAEDPSLAGESPQAIYQELGVKLRTQRELLGLSLPEVERQTHLKLHYIQALESGDYSSMPSPVQARGMLHNYGDFLGMDVDALLLRYADALQMDLLARRGPPKAGKKSQGTTPPPGWRRLLSADLVFGVSAVGVLLAFVIWAAVRVNTFTVETAPAETVPAISDVILPTATATPSPTPTALPQETMAAGNGFTSPVQEVQPTELPESAIVLPTQAGTQVQLYLVARQRAWMRVTVDGKTQFEGRVVPGSAYSFSGREAVELLTGNAAALQVVFNQRDLGILGGFGEVVDRIFTPLGIINPVPTATPVPEEPLATATPQPTPEGRP